MKKAIKILSVVAIIASVLFAALSVCLGYAQMNTLPFKPEKPDELTSLIVRVITNACVFVAVDAVIALYLVIFADKVRSFVPEIVIAAVRFTVLPFASSIVLRAVVNEYTLVLAGLSDVALYSAFNSGFNNPFNAFNVSSLLLTLALAFSIAVKVFAKREKKEEIR